MAVVFAQRKSTSTPSEPEAAAGSPAAAGARAGVPLYLRGAATRAIQPKLEVSTPHDALEEEADRVAAQVVAAPPRACPACGERASCSSCRSRIQASRMAGAHGVPRLDALPRSGPGRPLDAPVRAFMESRFGRSFADVRVHDTGAAARAATQIRARAFTSGNDIYFGAGRFAPETHEGRRLLAHELAHVTQQGGASTGVVQRQPEDHAEPAPRPLTSADQRVLGATPCSILWEELTAREILLLLNRARAYLDQHHAPTISGGADEVTDYYDFANLLDRLNRGRRAWVSNGHYYMAERGLVDLPPVVYAVTPVAPLALTVSRVDPATLTNRPGGDPSGRVWMTPAQLDRFLDARRVPRTTIAALAEGVARGDTTVNIPATVLSRIVPGPLRLGREMPNPLLESPVATTYESLFNPLHLDGASTSPLGRPVEERYLETADLALGRLRWAHDLLGGDASERYVVPRARPWLQEGGERGTDLAILASPLSARMPARLFGYDPVNPSWSQLLSPDRRPLAGAGEWDLLPQGRVPSIDEPSSIHTFAHDDMTATTLGRHGDDAGIFVSEARRRRGTEQWIPEYALAFMRQNPAAAAEMGIGVYRVGDRLYVHVPTHARIDEVAPLFGGFAGAQPVPDSSVNPRSDVPGLADGQLELDYAHQYLTPAYLASRTPIAEEGRFGLHDIHLHGIGNMLVPESILQRIRGRLQFAQHMRRWALGLQGPHQRVMLELFVPALGERRALGDIDMLENVNAALTHSLVAGLDNETRVLLGLMANLGEAPLGMVSLDNRPLSLGGFDRLDRKLDTLEQAIHLWRSLPPPKDRIAIGVLARNTPNDEAVQELAHLYELSPEMLDDPDDLLAAVAHVREQRSRLDPALVNPLGEAGIEDAMRHVGATLEAARSRAIRRNLLRTGGSLALNAGSSLLMQYISGDVSFHQTAVDTAGAETVNFINRRIADRIASPYVRPFASAGVGTAATIPLTMISMAFDDERHTRIDYAARTTRALISTAAGEATEAGTSALLVYAAGGSAVGPEGTIAGVLLGLTVGLLTDEVVGSAAEDYVRERLGERGCRDGVGPNR